MRVSIESLLRSDSFLSRDGREFSLDAERWKLSKDVDIPIVAISDYLDADTYNSLKNVLAFYSKTSSAKHVYNLFYRCKDYLDATKGQPPFSVVSLISYRSSLDKHTEWYMGTLRGLIRQWAQLGYPGIPKDSLALLDKWTIKGNEKGYAVQSMCPEAGPLTDIEMSAVTESVLAAFGNGDLALSDTCVIMTLAMTGRRPGQLAALKVKDLLPQDGKYYINFPRAKQRHEGWRRSFKKFSVVEDLWLLLQQQAEFTVEEFSVRMGQGLDRGIMGELPLFAELKHFRSDIPLSDQLEYDMLHMPTNRVNEALARVALTISVISERTGFPIHLNPTRFRYTLGTNLGREGLGEYVIAEALDHSDTQNVGVYVKNIPEIVERIDKAVALQLGPIAQQFQGVLITSESQARRAGDPSSRICGRSGNVGSCGSYGFCSALAPIACYTCMHFQPWLDGPHEAVLEQLISDRDSVYENTGDLKIASVNDRLILAVSDVVCRCKAAKAGEAYV
ncbi:site-specific integrase [Pseudomonas fluorescens]|uniref:DNA breaking-rejoining enzyme n=1 Tax=Pseudomonas fluorescens TaxID=294 RepID=A0A0F4VEY4_PSEFL|nr:site-specific integrase [Pseudomonas fluorescens]KJZ66552.1 DNA breaking-rejoining enzyme [Pseudomonas fluorescens]